MVVLELDDSILAVREAEGFVLLCVNRIGQAERAITFNLDTISMSATGNIYYLAKAFFLTQVICVISM